MEARFLVESVTLQDLVGAAERLAARKRATSSIEWLGVLDEARDRLAKTPFEAKPARTYKTGGAKPRTISILAPCDLLIADALHARLSRAYAVTVKPSVHGYVKGRSTRTAAQAVRDLINSGLPHLAHADIKDFFPSTQFAAVETLLGTLASPRVVDIVRGLVLAHSREVAAEQGDTVRGLPLGNPLSPLLSNMALEGFDANLESAGIQHVRYADDILLAAHSPEALTRCLSEVRRLLAALGLTLNEEKLKLRNALIGPVEYLGQMITPERIYVNVPDAPLNAPKSARPHSAGVALDMPASLESVFPPKRRTLYVAESLVYLRVDNGLIAIQHGKEVLRTVPLHRVERVVILGNASLSSGFVAACVAHGVHVLFFVQRGRGYASLIGGAAANPLRLRAQYDLASRPESRLHFAKTVIDYKLRAMALRLMRAESAASARAEIETLRPRIAEASDTASLMGIEGAATKAYFNGFASRIKNPAFEFVKRTKRPPRDAINSLLSFAYSLVFGEMQTAILAHGLDPYPGFVHDLRRGHPALASDMIEPYRPLVADSFVLKLVNNGIVHESGFERRGADAVLMTSDTRRAVIQSYEEFMTHPLGQGGARGSPRVLMHGAVCSLLRVILGETSELMFPMTGKDVDEEWVRDELEWVNGAHPNNPKESQHFHGKTG